MTEASERMSDEEAIAQLRKTVAAGERSLLFPSYNAQVVVLGVIDRLRSELSTRPLPEGAPTRMTDEDMDREANAFAMHLLVPSDLLRAELTKIGGIDLEDDRAVAKLAKKFRVSTQVMTIRIGQELSQ